MVRRVRRISSISDAEGTKCSMLDTKARHAGHESKTQRSGRPVSFLYLRSKSTKGSVAEMRVEKHLVKQTEQQEARTSEAGSGDKRKSEGTNEGI